MQWGAQDDPELVLDYTVAPLVSIVLANADTIVKRRDQRDGGPFEIGFHRELPPQYAGNLADRLYWLPGDGDTIVGALSVTSPGAAAVRAALRVRNLGDGEIRFFDEQSNSRHAPIRRGELSAEEWTDLQTRTIWSPVVDGDVVGVEVVLPSSARRGFSLIVEKISHIHTSPQSSAALSKDADCANHIDVQCRDDVVHEGWEDAVAKIVLEECGRSTIRLFRDIVERQRRRLVHPVLPDGGALRVLAGRCRHGRGLLVLSAGHVRGWRDGLQGAFRRPEGRTFWRVVPTRTPLCCG